MPLIKKKTAPKRKLVRRKRWARRPQRTLVNRALHPIPQRFITKMKYSETVTTDPLTGTYHMNLNSIYDPNRTGIGHQPYGYDQLAALYNRYRVISCGYRIQFANISSGNPIQIAVIPANQALVTSTISELRENPSCKYTIQNPGAGISTISGKCYIPSLIGRTRAQYMADDDYQAQVTTSPAELAVLTLMTASQTDAPAPNCTVQVLLEYTVEFFDRKSLGQS